MIYHVLKTVDWQSASKEKFYQPAAFAQDGFIHCCQAEMIEHVGNDYYRGEKGLALLAIDPRAVNAEIKYEDTVGGGFAFPHIYGPLNVDAVRAVIDFSPNPDGSFNIPAAIMELEA
jgi:uncharacterized protein (DUF952 family)